jgi:hypothetical protein
MSKLRQCERRSSHGGDRSALIDLVSVGPSIGMKNVFAYREYYQPNALISTHHGF